MHAHLLAGGTERTWAVILDSGDEVMASMRTFAREHDLGASRVSAIGAFAAAELGFYRIEARGYKRIAVEEQCEVVALLGDVARDQDDKPRLHLHVVLGLEDGSTRGGHLLAATVRPTLEVLITESPCHLHRRYDPASGLPLIDHADRED